MASRRPAFRVAMELLCCSPSPSLSSALEGRYSPPLQRNSIGWSREHATCRIFSRLPKCHSVHYLLCGERLRLWRMPLAPVSQWRTRMCSEVPTRRHLARPAEVYEHEGVRRGRGDEV